MVARIITGSGIHGLVRYNADKVDKGKASVLYAQGMLWDKPTPSQVIERFRKRMEKNVRTKTNVVHISLNFSIKDKLSEELMQKITMDYMERIGFGSQPFVVYRHDDTAHPHVHIITSNIDQDGKRIETHNLGKTLSEKARVEIEQKYGLVKAQGAKGMLQPITPLERISTADPGKKSKISNVITEVMRTYRYSSHGEFRAALSPFGIGFRIVEKQKGRGMLYFIQDDNGKPLGMPISASSIYSKPTYVNLEKRFVRNKLAKEMGKQKLKDKIRKLLDEAVGEKTGLSGFKQKLSRNAVHLHLAISSDGRAFGAVYVDHVSRSVFKGSELSKELSAGSISKVFELQSESKPGPLQVPVAKENLAPYSADDRGPFINDQEDIGSHLIWILGPDKRGAYVEDPQFTGRVRKRKKRKKGSR